MSVFSTFTGYRPYSHSEKIATAASLHSTYYDEK